MAEEQTKVSSEKNIDMHGIRIENLNANKIPLYRALEMTHRTVR